MYSILKFVFEITFVICIVRGQEDICYTPLQDEGLCVLLDDCEILKPLITKSREDLKNYHCGWKNNTPMVCCPSPTATTTTSTTTVSAVTPGKKCVTIEGSFGSCVPLQSCFHITKMLATKTPQSLNYFQRSRCIGSTENNVCCDLNIRPSSEVVLRDNTCPESALPPDPTSQCCGIETYSGNKVFNGNETGIDQFPWLVLIEYTRPQLCGGSLISHKYVLTAAHCILNKANKPRGAVAVVLGEYNTTNSGRDCVQVEGGGEDCTLGEVRVPIESAIAHPEYKTHKTVQYVHDIALLRLATMVTFTDFIRPICLPKSDITVKPPKDLTFFVSGWGAVSETRITSDVKLYTSLPFVDHQKCRSFFNTAQGALIWEQQICAGGVLNRDTCKGDSGGPLIYENDKTNEVVGVISFGLLQCGLKTPSVYTKVYDYMSWITDTIKP